MPLVVKDLRSLNVFMGSVCSYCDTHGSELLFCPEPTNMHACAQIVHETLWGHWKKKALFIKLILL